MGRPAPVVARLARPGGVLALSLALALGGISPAGTPARPALTRIVGTAPAVTNFTSAINRLVELLGLAGGGILALAWARVALSWFSNDVTKKIQAKDRARDALIGTLLFVAAVSGLIYALAHWVVTGT